MTQSARHESNQRSDQAQDRESEKAELRRRLLEMIKRKESLRREKPR